MLGIFVDMFPQKTQVWLVITVYVKCCCGIAFSGSIYGLCLGGPRLLGPVTPIGGLSLMTGWGLLLMGLESNK